MVETRTVTPLQLDSSKCGFGHFYYSVRPDPRILPIWEALEMKHKKFHKYGTMVISALKNDSYSEAERIYREAAQYSKELIADLEQILQSAED